MASEASGISLCLTQDVEVRETGNLTHLATHLRSLHLVRSPTTVFYIIYPKLSKMDSDKIEPYGNWDGHFTWHGKFMREYVKLVTRKYDKHDPRTWPLIHRSASTETGFNYGNSKFIPEYMVYDQALMERMDKCDILRISRNRTTTGGKNGLFCYYPFNYDRHGELRKYPHIPSEELEEWMSRTTRPVPTTHEKADTENTLSNEDAIEDSSSKAAIHEIMKMLDDTDTATTTRVTELEEELGETRKEVLEANIRADSAEKRSTQMGEHYQAAWKERSVKAKELVDEHREQTRKLLLQQRTNLSNAKALLATVTSKYDETRAGAQIADKKIKELEERLVKVERIHKRSTEEVARLKDQVKQGNRDTATAQQQAAAAKQETMVEKQQIFRILEEMKKKKQGTSLQKKKAEDEIADPPRKKPKIEV
ncbi:hypothetical protein J4E86_007109 [Alternaria arbusti]|uniref:uncharacterized protein n=1 Tax=Alternaria arbusti TaxID=232088 RepID=UPI002220A26A|nr:uncharacterized protein J4E86_007109 [Alternaria arbusti]KAI4951693.1 hypothetical protein J4E86_007109 [Alternaria arbusti]